MKHEHESNLRWNFHFLIPKHPISSCLLAGRNRIESQASEHRKLIIAIVVATSQPSCCGQRNPLMTTERFLRRQGIDPDLQRYPPAKGTGASLTDKPGNQCRLNRSAGSCRSITMPTPVVVADAPAFQLILETLTQVSGSKDWKVPSTRQLASDAFAASR